MRNPTLVAAAVALAFSSYAPRAEACGGLFCSSSQPIPVDQNAERILFEIDPGGSVTATVEISYTGDPAAFSWIVPVPETPVLSVVPAGTLRVLDVATAPQITPQPLTCTQQQGPFVPMMGCQDNDMMGMRPPLTGGPAEGDVDVVNLPRVGPYDDNVVVESEDPDALVAWLNDNGYVVTAAMEPVIAEYALDGYKFLAVKLAPDVGVNDIQPLRFTCPAQDGLASIPLRLTAVSAEPEMSIVVFVAGQDRYAPLSYREIDVGDDQIQASSATGQSNYYPLVSWLVDEAGGKAFLTEYAGTSSATRDLLSRSQWVDPEGYESANNILLGHSYVTRLYTRMSGWEMDDDPTFAPSGGRDVSNVRDLSDRPPVEVCATAAPGAVACGSTYCGAGSHCAATEDGVDGCVCAPGTSARRVNTPAGPSVFCQDVAVDYLASLATQLQAACDQTECGARGSCRIVGGFPTCECDEGYAAVALAAVGDGDQGVRCRAVVTAFEPERLLWAEGFERDVTDPDESAGCGSAAPAGAGSFALWLSLAWGALVVVRRALGRRS